MALTVKEKELANIGASVATGCKPCTDFHFKKVRQAGAKDEEIKAAISFAVLVRDSAQAIMRNHGLHHLGLAEEEGEAASCGEVTRIQELVSVAAAFAVNCTTNVKRHIELARSIGITESEIESVLDAASFIKEEAAHYVEQIVKLEKKSDELQELLDELKATQAQLVQSEKMAALSKIVAGFAHELNTPLGAINSSTDVSSRAVTKIGDVLENSENLEELKESRQLGSALECLQKSHEATAAAIERISRIVTSLKSFIRMDESEYQNACVHEGLDSTLTLLANLFEERIKVEKDYGEVPTIYCNPSELNQVFMHLLTNAAQAIRAKGTITIRTSSCGPEVYVEIIDTGIGILPDQVKGIFDPSFTKDGSRIKAGLGLFTSYRIVQGHQGRIEVESEVGKGSRFRVILPKKADPKGPVQVKTEKAGPGHRCERLDS